MGTSRLNIWISDAADPCGTCESSRTITVFDCKGILEWPIEGIVDQKILRGFSRHTVEQIIERSFDALFESARDTITASKEEVKQR